MSLANKNIPSGMPQITSAFGGWMKNITLQKSKQCIVDGLVQQTETPFTFQGAIQPLSPKQIALKPEGQRAWTWLQIHCMLPGAIDVTDLIVYNGAIFKVMGVYDYSLNGFMEYHLVHDFQGSGPWGSS